MSILAKLKNIVLATQGEFRNCCVC